MTSIPLRLLLGTEQPCGYLPRRLSRSAFVAPHTQVTGEVYSALISNGFRRSGDYAYRPACSGCTACVPVRVPVASFAPSRAQRRCLKRNADLVIERRHTLTDAHFELYRRYLLARHPFGGMDADDSQAFKAFLGSTWGVTEFWCFYEGSVLRMVSVVDRLPQGLSAVYTFFDPDQPARSLGTYGVLSQLAAAKAEGLEHLYLGYWVQGSSTMDYKRQFQPLEALEGNAWRALPARVAPAGVSAHNAHPLATP